MKLLKICYEKYGEESSSVFSVSEQVKDENKIYTLKTSNGISNYWCKDGQELLKILDDGNGYTLHLNGKKIRLNYADTECIQVLLKYINRQEGQSFTVKELKLTSKEV